MGNKQFQVGKDFGRKGRGIDWQPVQDVSKPDSDCASLRDGVPVADPAFDERRDFLPLAVGQGSGGFLVEGGGV